MAFPILLAAFILVPVIEITLLIKVGSAVGVGTTILVVIFTAIIGAYLVKQQGFATLQTVQEEMNEGRVPALQMAEGIALLIAGAVLLTPGFMTDAFGFALLTPPIRKGIINWFISKQILKTQSTSSSSSYSSNQSNTQQSPNSGSVIEGEYSERD